MRSVVAFSIFAITLAACAAPSDGSDGSQGGQAISGNAASDAADRANLARVRADLEKTFDPTTPPAELTGKLPSAAQKTRDAYDAQGENFTAVYQVKANGGDVFVVVGNVVDVDFELAVFDSGGLAVSGQFLGDHAKGKQWAWDANPQGTPHTESAVAATPSDPAKAVKLYLQRGFHPAKPPTEFNGTVPGTAEDATFKSYENLDSDGNAQNPTAVYKVKMSGADLYVVSGNIVDFDFEVAAFDSTGVLVLTGLYHADAVKKKWTWDATPLPTSHNAP